MGGLEALDTPQPLGKETYSTKKSTFCGSNCYSVRSELSYYFRQTGDCVVLRQRGALGVEENEAQ